MPKTGFDTKKITTETLGEYLSEVRASLGFSPEQVQRLTQIPVKYLLALEDGNYAALPSDIYAKGFLKSLAAIYKVPVDSLISQFQKERSLERSLQEDPLTPRASKFTPLENATGTDGGALKSFGNQRGFTTAEGSLTGFIPAGLVITPRTIMLTVVAIAVVASIGYLIWQIRSVTAAPLLVLSYPAEDLTVSTRNILLRGRTETGGRLAINGQSLAVDEDGAFREVVNLTAGTNNLLIRAENKFGKSSELKRTVVVTAPAQIAGASTPVSAPATINIQIHIGPADTWIQIIADGQTVQDDIVAIGKDLQFTAEKELTLSSGNAGATRVLYNGFDLGLLGREGEVVSNVRFTAR